LEIIIMKFVNTLAIIATFSAGVAATQEGKGKNAGTRNMKKKGGTTKGAKAAKDICGQTTLDPDTCGKFRFNTVTFQDGPNAGDQVNFCFPMTLDQLPPAANTNAESIRTFEDFQTQRFSRGNCYSDIVDMWTEIGGFRMIPTHPDDPEPENREAYWNEVRELIALYYLRENNHKSEEVFDQISLMSPPPITFVFDPRDSIDKSGQHVCCDFPTTHVTDFILGNEDDPETAAKLAEVPAANRQLLNFNFGQMDPDLFAQPECVSENQKEFVNAQVAMGKILGWTVDTVSAVAFASKWAGGRARPQEIVFDIHENGGANFEDVPEDVIRNIQNMNLANELDFTAYKSKGAPGHPAHPAMHSAGSAISSWIQVVTDPSPAQISLSQHYDWSIAYFRSFAGVHYPSDNRAGLQLGRFILGQNGPEYLSQEYGCSDASRQAILDEANSKRPDVDWSNYFPPGWKDPVMLSNSLNYTDLICVNC